MTRVNTLSALAKSIRRANPDSAIEIENKAFSLAREIGYDHGAAEASHHLGVLYYYFKGDRGSALASFQQSLKIVEKIGDVHRAIKLLEKIGEVHSNQGRHDLALDYYLQSLRMCEKLDVQESGMGLTGEELKLTAGILERIGISYSYQNQHTRALENYRKCLHLRQKTGNQRDIARVYKNIGQVYLNQEKYNQALDHFYKALAMYQNAGIQRGIAGTYAKMGNTFGKMGQYRKALEFCRKGFEIQRNINNGVGLAYALRNMSDLYMKLGRYDSALVAAKSSYTIASRLGGANLRSAATESLSEAYRAIGDYKNAYIYKSEFIALRDSIINEENLRSINEMEAKYKAEKREQQIALLEKDKELQASLLERETLMRNFFIAGLVGAIILSILLYHRYRYRKRTGEELQRSYDELKRTQQQLIHAEKMATLGELTAGVAHEIKNPLNFVTNFSAMNEELVAELEEHANGNPEMKETLELLKGNTTRIREHGSRADRIVNGMLMHSRETKGVRHEAEINDLVREAVDLARHGAPHGAEVEIDMDLAEETGRANVLPAEISRVVLNLVGNAVYAAHKRYERQGGDEPLVTVSSRRENGNISVVVSDNGIGMNEEVKKKMFQPFFTTKPTGDGTGLGLSLSWDIVANGHHGTIEVESEEGKGATFKVKLPVQ